MTCRPSKRQCVLARCVATVASSRTRRRSSTHSRYASYRCAAIQPTDSERHRAIKLYWVHLLQKHNCLNNNAAIPSRPDPMPMATFRGAPLTHETAEDLCIGFLGEKPWSWKVVCGQNAAYDMFPCQVRCRSFRWLTPPSFLTLVACFAASAFLS
jgi:hypothetical protein